MCMINQVHICADPYLLGDIIIDNNVTNLVEQLSKRGDGGAGGGYVLNAAAPQESVQLPVSQSSTAWTLQHEAWRRMCVLDTQHKSENAVKDSDTTIQKCEN